MIEKKLEILERNTKEKNIRNNPEKRKQTRNRGTKNRRVG